MGLVLAFISLRLATAGGCSEGVIAPAVALARKLKKLSMLDVSIMGVVVVVMSLRNLREKGVIISMGNGLVVLLGAEMCHYAAFHLVNNAAADVAEGDSAEKSTAPTSSDVLSVFV